MSAVALERYRDDVFPWVGVDQGRTCEPPHRIQTLRQVAA